MPERPPTSPLVTLPTGAASAPWHSHYELLLTPRPAYSLTETPDIYSGRLEMSLLPAATAFVEAVAQSRGASKACGTASLERIDRLAALFDNATTEHSTNYEFPGQWGIFARGGQRDYEGSKTSFIHAELCPRKRLHTVCEIGFNAGLSAFLFLETLPHARYVGWDLGDHRWSRKNVDLLRQAYGERFGGVVFGRAGSTLPAYHTRHPEVVCDVVYVDGAKGYNPVLLNLLDLRNVSYPGSVLLFDEATSEACVNGTLLEGVDRSCDGPVDLRTGLGMHSSARAYNVASRAGLIRVSGCAATPYQDWSEGWRMDTLCAGTYLK